MEDVKKADKTWVYLLIALIIVLFIIMTSIVGIVVLEPKALENITLQVTLA